MISATFGSLGHTLDPVSVLVQQLVQVISTLVLQRAAVADIHRLASFCVCRSPVHLSMPAYRRDLVVKPSISCKLINLVLLSSSILLCSSILAIKLTCLLIFIHKSNVIWIGTGTLHSPFAPGRCELSENGGNLPNLRVVVHDAEGAVRPLRIHQLCPNYADVTEGLAQQKKSAGSQLSSSSTSGRVSVACCDRRKSAAQGERLVSAL